jgi:hypothetical protein
MENGQHIEDQIDLGLDAQLGRHLPSLRLQKIITYSVIIEMPPELRCKQEIVQLNWAVNKEFLSKLKATRKICIFFYE